MSDNAFGIAVAIVVAIIVMAVSVLIGFSMQQDRITMRQKVAVCSRIENNNLKITCLQSLSPGYRR